MITEYKRPKSLVEAEKYINNGWKILAGGGYISKHQDENMKVIDLQDLKLNYCQIEKNKLLIGATTTLQELIDCEEIPLGLKTLIKREKSFNIRNAASIIGTILTSDGRSNILAWLITNKTQIKINQQTMLLSDYLNNPQKGLITEIVIFPENGVRFETVSRTPDDFSMIGVFLGYDPEGNLSKAVFNGITNETPVEISINSKEDDAQIVFEKFINSHSQLTTMWTNSIYQKEIIKNLLVRLMANDWRGNNDH